MKLSTCRQLIAVGTGMIVWSTIVLTSIHGGVLLAAVTR